MKVLDRYLIRELLFPVVFCSLTLVFLVLIADLFDNIDDLIENRTPPLIILKYYLALAPYAFSQTIAWATWLGTVYVLVHFGLHNETVAMKAAGLKISAIVRPILFTGFLIGIIVFLVNDRVVPPAYRLATELEKNYVHSEDHETDAEVIRNVTYFADGEQIYYFRKFYPGAKRVEDAIVLWLDREERSTRQKMLAKEAVWNGKNWDFKGVMEYQMDSQGRILGEPQNFPEKTYSTISVTPADLVSASTETTFLSYHQLKSTIKKLSENGVNVDSEKVAMHYRLASPWQGLVMMLVAVPLLAPTRNRKTIAASVLFCVILVFIFHVTGAVGIALGKAGKLFPFLSAWAANILFAIGALFTLEKANF